MARVGATASMLAAVLGGGALPNIASAASSQGNTQAAAHTNGNAAAAPGHTGASGASGGNGNNGNSGASKGGGGGNGASTNSGNGGSTRPGQMAVNAGPGPSTAPGCAWGPGSNHVPDPPNGGVNGQTQTAPGCDHGRATAGAEVAAGQTANDVSAAAGANGSSETSGSQANGGESAGSAANGGDASGSVAGVTASGPAPAGEEGGAVAGVTSNAPESSVAAAAIPAALPATGSGGMADGETVLTEVAGVTIVIGLGALGSVAALRRAR